MSTGMSNAELIILSGSAMLLFLPSWLAYLLSERYLAAVLVQLVVGISAGAVSGYFLDSLLSCLMVGVMASLTLWIVAFFRPDANLLYWAAGAVALIACLLNIGGHTLGTRPFWFYLLLLGSSVVVAQGIAWITYRVVGWLTPC
ncbi:MAG: hypothetical protein AAF944_06890 [Bacteroidota bacterium]